MKRASHDIQIFDDEGNLNFQQVGVHSFHFKSLSIFYLLRSQSWKTLLSFSISLYLLVVLLFTLCYYGWSYVCGAHEGTSFISSLYFSVVSLAANGGYMGEDDDEMTDPLSVCYRGRAILVMMCSYVNIIFVGLVAALVVGKAEYTGKLGNRIVFSDFCTLVPVPGRLDRWKISFRMANVENSKPIAQGRLRLFVVSAEPLDEYRQIQREKRLWRRSRRNLLPQEKDKGDRGSNQSTSSRSVLPSAPLTSELLRQKKADKQLDHHDDPIMMALMKFKQEEGKKKAAEVKKQAQTRGRSRHKKSKKARDSKMQSLNNVAELGKSRGSSSSSTNASDTLSDVSVRTRSPPSSDNDSEGAPPKPAQSAEHGTSVGETATHQTGRKEGVTVEILSDKTNSSFQPSEHDNFAADSPTFPSAAGGGKFPSGGGKTSSRREEETDDFKRVRLSVSELRWLCAEETYLEKDSDQLSLWYPSTITHTIDERSPLYHFLNLPRLTALVLGDTTSPVGDGTGKRELDYDAINEINKSSGPNYQGQQLNSNRFQIVAVFDATEMESGAVIVSKKTYNTTNIVTHYRFSSKLVHIKPISNQVLLDYHYFNALVPNMTIENSSSDSDNN
ncbi:hypothetical protein AGDE_16513 [Angomonas deanei]|nr:hypothetical protein AGDE_16513 [Angomonas deanei]|eukprot:EPY16963.1 hypothetical protein AGDE_16513 [Angomonas deanei]